MTTHLKSSVYYTDISVLLFFLFFINSEFSCLYRVEMMTRDQMAGRGFEDLNSKIMDYEDAKNCLIPMG